MQQSRTHSKQLQQRRSGDNRNRTRESQRQRSLRSNKPKRPWQTSRPQKVGRRSWNGLSRSHNRKRSGPKRSLSSQPRRSRPQKSEQIGRRWRSGRKSRRKTTRPCPLPPQRCEGPSPSPCPCPCHQLRSRAPCLSLCLSSLRSHTQFFAHLGGRAAASSRGATQARGGRAPFPGR